MPTGPSTALRVADSAAVLAPAAAYAVDPLPPGTRLKEFEILRVIGIGGFSIVYLALDTMLLREIAIKEYLPGPWVARSAGDTAVRVPREEQRADFERGLRSFLAEAQLLAGFRHESLVEVHRFWEANDTAYMAMRYHEGRTLRQLRAGLSGDPNPQWLRTLIEPVLGALEVLHAGAVYHRDIAPDNILVPPGGAAVLLDFGAARRVVDDRTQAFTAILKPNYAPIEQYGDSPALRQGPWTDLYALGAVLRFMMTGLEPTPAVMRVVADGQPPLADEAGAAARTPVEQALRRAIDWALAVDPQQRPRSVSAWRAVLDGAPVPAFQRAPEPAPALRRPRPPGTLEWVEPATANGFVSTIVEEAWPGESHSGWPDAPASRRGAAALPSAPLPLLTAAPRAERRGRLVFGASVAAAALAGVVLAVGVMLAIRTAPVETKVAADRAQPSPAAAAGDAPASSAPAAAPARTAAATRIAASPASTDRAPVRHASSAAPRPVRGSETLALSDVAARSTACTQTNSLLRAICVARMCSAPAMREHPQCVERQAAEDARQRAQMNR